MQAGSRRAPRVRRSGPARTNETRPPVDDGRPRLRLALSRGHLALELDAPYRLGPLRLIELTTLVPDVRFPVDLSGGVTRFRHRRGHLSKLAIETRPVEIGAHVAPHLKGILPGGPPRLTVAVGHGSLLVGLATEEAALAFDVVIVPQDDGLALLLDGPRGHALGAPAVHVALRVLAAAVGRDVAAVGSGVRVPGLARRVALAVLPECGARAPEARGLRLRVETAPDRVTVIGELDGPTSAMDARAARALELSALVGDADVVALAGRLDEARTAYLAALERAPRHEDLVRRVVELDRAVGDREEAALGMLVELGSAIDGGVLGAALLLATGDREGAREAFSRAARLEPYGGLAAHALLAAASLEDDPRARRELCDEAVARAPHLTVARWERLGARLVLGDVAGAGAEAEHLEALASSSAERLAVNLRVGSMLLDRGHAAQAERRFVRALRFAPTDPSASLGLARALRDVGKAERALELFGRAIAHAGKRSMRLPEAELELARLLATFAHDRPAAIARLGAILPEESAFWEARVLDAELRFAVGDIAGASRSLARLRARAEGSREGDVDATTLAWLKRAAVIEERDLSDLHAAERTWLVASRLFPRDRAAASEARRVHRSRLATPDEPVSPPPLPPAPVSLPVAQGAAGPGAPGGPVEVEDVEARIEQLTQTLRANPADDVVALELAGLLEGVGRDLDLVALASARIEEGSPRAAELAAFRRRAFSRLAEAAEREGRPDEASLYRSMAEADRAD